MGDSSPFVTFAEASRDALMIGQRMSLPDRFRWLEEMEELGLRMQAWRWRAGLSVDARLRPLFEARYGYLVVNAPPMQMKVAEEQAPCPPKPGAGSSKQ